MKKKKKSMINSTRKQTKQEMFLVKIKLWWQKNEQNDTHLHIYVVSWTTNMLVQSHATKFDNTNYIPIQLDNVVTLFPNS